MHNSIDSKSLFENAKRLNGRFENIESEYINYLSNEKVDSYPNDKVDVQLKTIVYLLARTGWNIGHNEFTIDNEQSNCVDFLSMQVKHVDLIKQNRIHFNWIGENDVEFDKTLRVNEHIYMLFGKFLQGKHNDERIFDAISNENLLAFINTTYGNGLTPTHFVIYLASKTFEKILKEMSDEWLTSYPTANRHVGLVKRYKEALQFVQELLNQKNLDAVDSYIDPRIFISWYVRVIYGSNHSKENN